jgi:hypothetical protein
MCVCVHIQVSGSSVECGLGRCVGGVPGAVQKQRERDGIDGGGGLVGAEIDGDETGVVSECANCARIGGGENLATPSRPRSSFNCDYLTRRVAATRACVPVHHVDESR